MGYDTCFRLHKVVCLSGSKSVLHRFVLMLLVHGFFLWCCYCVFFVCWHFNN